VRAAQQVGRNADGAGSIQLGISQIGRQPVGNDMKYAVLGPAGMPNNDFEHVDAIPEVGIVMPGLGGDIAVVRLGEDHKRIHACGLQ